MIGGAIIVGGIIALAYVCEHVDSWLAARRDIKRRLNWRG